MKVGFTIDTKNISGLNPLFDLDANGSKPLIDSDLEGVSCIKCDGEYFKVPDNWETIADIAVDENLVSEAEALGLQKMMQKYITPHFDVKVR